MTGKNGLVSIRCSHCGKVLGVIGESDNNIVVDFLGHLKKYHPKCLMTSNVDTAIQCAIRQESAIRDANRKTEDSKGKHLVHPYLPPQ